MVYIPWSRKPWRFFLIWSSHPENEINDCAIRHNHPAALSCSATTSFLYEYIVIYYVVFDEYKSVRNGFLLASNDGFETKSISASQTHDVIKTLGMV